MSALRVLVYVQHLLGIGHLKRAATISNALAESGCDVALVSGGMPVSQIELGGATLEQLPPIRASEDFSRLLNDQGDDIDTTFKSLRRDRLLGFWQAFQPDVLIVELFPFGRRQMRFELLPLLSEATTAARPPIVIASVRDILQNRTPERVREALRWFYSYYDYLLVHADPDVVRLEASVPAVTDITDRIHYTGYVFDGGRGSMDEPRQNSGDVVVSAGGGAVGEALLRTAIAARSETIYRDRTWRVLVGRGVSRCDFDSLAGEALPGVIVERARSDFSELLAAGELSISQCGYNTMTEILGAKISAVVVPFVGDGETEQTARAEIWAARGRVTIATENDLSPATMAAAVNAAAKLPVPDALGVNMNGANQTAELITRLARSRAVP